MALEKKMIKKNKMRRGQWIKELFKAKENYSYVHFETSDGIKRSGRLTDLRIKTLIFNGRKVELIEEFELNGDIMDCIPFNRIAKIKVE